jgi:predicted dehydrogenase
VYQCENNQPDHQTAQFQFSGGQTATFTVTAFSSGRTLEIHGTRRSLRAGTEVLVVDHVTKQSKVIPFLTEATAAEGYDEHGGGDFGLVSSLYEQMTTADPADMTTGIQQAVASHLMALAADESRRTGKTVSLEEFRRHHETHLPQEFY